MGKPADVRLSDMKEPPRRLSGHDVLTSEMPSHPIDR